MAKRMLSLLAALRPVLTTLGELVGLGLIAAAGFRVAVPLGLALSGAALFLVSAVAER